MHYVIIGLIVAFFVWAALPAKKRRAQDSGSDGRNMERPDQSAAAGLGTGMMGGDIEDASIAQYALSRTKKDPKTSHAGDLGTALGMQDAMGDGDGS